MLVCTTTNIDYDFCKCNLLISLSCYLLFGQNVAFLGQKNCPTHNITINLLY